MRLTVAHSTTYRFERPVRSVIQSHRLVPSSHEGQQVRAWAVSAEGAVFGAFHRDGAGDQIRTMSLAGPLTEFRIEVKGEIETSGQDGILRGLAERIPPACYLRPTDFTAPTEEIRALASKADGQTNPLDTAHALAHLVADAIAYTPGSTHAHTTAAEALSEGVGVCQDHAHVLIAAARARQMPARYVTGYLFADADGAAHEASHAWAEIRIEGLGWIGFDAANTCCADERYVRIGSGLDALDAAPIRGITQGRAPEALDVVVAVQAAGQ